MKVNKNNWTDASWKIKRYAIICVTEITAWKRAVPQHKALGVL